MNAKANLQRPSKKKKKYWYVVCVIGYMYIDLFHVPSLRYVPFVCIHMHIDNTVVFVAVDNDHHDCDTIY